MTVCGKSLEERKVGNHTVKVATTATVYVCVNRGCLSETVSEAGVLSNMLALNVKRKRFRLM